MMEPIIEDTKSTLGDRATVLKVDIDKNRDAAIQYGVRSVPTLILFKNGEPVWRQSGVVHKNVLVETITPML
jgi:thioredoxin 1